MTRILLTSAGTGSLCGLLFVTLMASSCGQTHQSLALGSETVRICNSYLPKDGMTKKEGVDFQTASWQIGPSRVFIYVGTQPNFPEIIEIERKIKTITEPVFLAKFASQGRLQTLYGFPTKIGFTGFAHVSITGSEDIATLSRKIGEGFEICGADLR